jgi:NifU-like protein involved in Fe-S cluster formation
MAYSDKVPDHCANPRNVGSYDSKRGLSAEENAPVAAQQIA